jgi:hypothetical protein
MIEVCNNCPSLSIRLLDSACHPPLPCSPQAKTSATAAGSAAHTPTRVLSRAGDGESGLDKSDGGAVCVGQTPGLPVVGPLALHANSSHPAATPAPRQTSFVNSWPIRQSIPEAAPLVSHRHTAPSTSPKNGPPFPSAAFWRWAFQSAAAAETAATFAPGPFSS